MEITGVCHRSPGSCLWCHLLASSLLGTNTATMTSIRGGNPIDLDLAVPMSCHGGRPEEPRAELRMARRGRRNILATATATPVASSSSSVAYSARTSAPLRTLNDSLVPLDVRFLWLIAAATGIHFLHLLLGCLVKTFRLLLLLASLRWPLISHPL